MLGGVAQQNLSCALVDDCLAEGRGGEAAIREPKRVWTYARLDDEAARVAAALRELGVKPGERVALVMHDSAELAATFIGALRVGAVPVPLNVLLRPLELRALLLDCRAVEVIDASDRVLSTAKLSTAYGLGMGLLFPLIAGAATFLLPGRARPRTLFDVLTAFNPTLFAATPSLYAQLCHDYAAISHPRPTLMG